MFAASWFNLIYDRIHLALPVSPLVIDLALETDFILVRHLLVSVLDLLGLSFPLLAHRFKNVSFSFEACHIISIVEIESCPWLLTEIFLRFLPVLILKLFFEASVLLIIKLFIGLPFVELGFLDLRFFDEFLAFLFFESCPHLADDFSQDSVGHTIFPDLGLHLFLEQHFRLKVPQSSRFFFPVILVAQFLECLMSLGNLRVILILLLVTQV